MNNIHEYINALDYTVVLLYLVVLIGIGFWVSFIKKKKEGENLFLAGHSLRWPAIGLTMWGTNVGPSMLVITAHHFFMTLMRMMSWKDPQLQIQDHTTALHLTQ